MTCPNFNAMSLALKYPRHMDVPVTNQDIKLLSDEELMIAYAHESNEKAFAELYARYKQSLYRYCVRMLNDEGLGADVYQETWSKVIKAREKYQVKAKFKTYIFHVAHNLIIDTWRKRSSRGEKLEFVSIDNDSDDSFNIELEANANVFDDIQSEEQLIQFKLALEQIPPEQRDALLLHYEQGLTLQQIADMEKVGRETIKSRLRYAVKKLKILISGMNEVTQLSEVQT